MISEQEFEKMKEQFNQMKDELRDMVEYVKLVESVLRKSTPFNSFGTCKFCKKQLSHGNDCQYIDIVSGRLRHL
jgi:hypothetical protein